MFPVDDFGESCRAHPNARNGTSLDGTGGVALMDITIATGYSSSGIGSNYSLCSSPEVLVLKREDNEKLTRTGPGTPLGGLMRAYWQPAALVSELPTERPV